MSEKAEGKRLTSKGTWSLFALMLGVILATGVSEFSNSLDFVSKSVKKEKAKTVINKELSYEEKINQYLIKYSKVYNVSPKLAKAVIIQESRLKHDRMRYEETWKRQYSDDWKRKRWMNGIEYNMYFTSIGLMQIGYGLHKDFCELKSFTDLFNPEKNISCGMKILSKCLETNASITPKRALIRTCLRSYNGSGAMAEKYADKVLRSFLDMLLEDEPLTSS